MRFKKEDKYKMSGIENIIKVYQGEEPETYINEFGNVIIRPKDETIVGTKLYIRKTGSRITLATIQVGKHNKGTATKIIEELIRIARNSDDVKVLEIENILNPALKHIAVEKFKFTEHEFCKETYVLNLD